MHSQRRLGFRSSFFFVASSLSVALAGCQEVDVDPILKGTSSAASGAPLSQGGPMDVLFVVDDSSSMHDKQAYLGEAAQTFLTRLANPSCVDANQHVLGVSHYGTCETGTPEFVAVSDIHVGIVSTSLGLGSPDDSECLNLHAHLNFDANSALTTVDPSTGVFQWTRSAGDISKLTTEITQSILAMGESGCGIESQLESWYRFLVQPDPYDHLSFGGNGDQVQYVGVDDTLLKQRKAFLRPNSTVAVVLLSDENDSSLDPLALSGTAFRLLDPSFQLLAPTAACATDPTSADCTSCGFLEASPDLANHPECDAPLPAAGSGALTNTRLFHVKQRFGVDPQFPVARYASGLTSRRVPDRDGEHPPSAPPTPGNYVGDADCDNPLFAATLPSDSSSDTCHLPRGTRNANQIFFSVIAGVPHQLLQTNASDASSPLKSTLSEADYNVLLGTDPLDYDFAGVDIHMLESLTPRAGISRGDPIVLGDWDTQGEDLERACTFQLPAPIDESAGKPYGDCTTSGPPYPESSLDPVCASDGSQTQVYAGATPAVRELALARALGYQAIVSSICPIHVEIAPDGGGKSLTAVVNVTHDPLFGYEPASNYLIDRMAGK